jgi:hypothetical protein
MLLDAMAVGLKLEDALLLPSNNDAPLHTAPT